MPISAYSTSPSVSNLDVSNALLNLQQASPPILGLLAWMSEIRNLDIAVRVSDQNINGAVTIDNRNGNGH